jgi:hypothetical protein
VLVDSAGLQATRRATRPRVPPAASGVNPETKRDTKPLDDPAEPGDP